MRERERRRRRPVMETKEGRGSARWWVISGDEIFFNFINSLDK